MSNFSVTARCGCTINTWDPPGSTESINQLVPCELHGAAEVLLASLKEIHRVAFEHNFWMESLTKIRELSTAAIAKAEVRS